MAGWDDVARLALSLPEVAEEPVHGNRAWRVRRKLIVWERPLREKEIDELGAAAPEGEVLGARVPDLGAKEGLIGDEPEVYFTTSHFDGRPSVLVRLERVGVDDLEELTIEAWLARAPKRLVKSYLDSRQPGGGGAGKR